MKISDDHCTDGCICMRAPFAEKDGFLYSVFRGIFYPAHISPGPWTTCNVRRYGDRLEFCWGFPKKMCKAISFDQISSFETASLLPGVSAVKKISYFERGKKIQIDVMPWKNDSLAVVLRRRIPEKEKAVVL